MKTLKYLGLVPARAGSKGLVGKNMRLLGGRPLIQYSIEAGLASRRLDRVLLSSDSLEMIDLARKLGCDAPFVRPAAISGDDASVVDVVLHAVDFLAAAESTGVENVVLLQPTQPFRAPADIDGAIAAFESSAAETLFSVEEAAQHPCECVMIDGGRTRWAMTPPEGAAGRQSFPEVYYINGAVYVTSVAFLRRHRAFQDARTVSYVMPRSRGLDINELYDFQVGEGLVRLAADGARVFDDAAPVEEQ